MLAELETNTLFYASIICISLIYTCGIFVILNFIQFIKFSVYIHASQPFFQIRRPKLTILYISLFIFALYVSNPLTLILLNIVDAKYKQIALYIQDSTSTLILISFFIRIWNIWLDQYFIDTVTNWIWKREVNPMESETNVLIKYSKIIQSKRHLIIILFYILLIAPLFITLLILSNNNYNMVYINHFIFNNFIDICRIIYLIIFIILLSAIFYVSYNKTYIVTDEYHIRSELTRSIISAGSLYTLSLILSSVHTDYYTSIRSEWKLVCNVMLTHIGNLCVIYYTSYWTQKQFKFLNLFNANASPFFTIFSQKQVIKFEHLMNNKQAINAFSHQLVAEWGLESMCFIIEVSQFKAVIKTKYPSYADDFKEDINEKDSKLCTDNTLFSVSNILNINWMPINNRMEIHSPHKIALYLYDKYIDSSADLCINISSVNRRFIYNIFKQIAEQLHDEAILNTYYPMLSNPNKEFQSNVLGILYTVFDNALKEIWHLIKNDPYFRFRQSEKFNHLLFVLYPTKVKKMFNEYMKTKLKKKIKLKPQVKVKSTSVQIEDEPEPETCGSYTSVNVKTPVINTNNTCDNKEKYQPQLYVKHGRASSVQLHSMSTLQHIEEHAGLRVKTDRQKSSDFLEQYADISDDIVVPSQILQCCYSFWRSNIKTLSKANKLEIGMTMYMTLISQDKSILRAINKYQMGQKQARAYSLQFLNMINWLTVSLWNRDNHNLHESFSKIGTLHKKFKIETKHFQLLLKVLHETLIHYFPQKYTLQNQFAFDYIFAYSVEIIMKQPLSYKTIHKSYYKELESKFNSFVKS